MLARQLLATKFQPPLLSPSRVVRARLIQKLEQGWASGSRLALICAPAGYGKTTLAVEWVQQGKRFSWISLDESDNDLHRFFTGLVTALQKIDPAVGASTLSLLAVPQTPPVEILAVELINEISAVETPFILVLDDYQHIHTPAIHEALEMLLDHQPVGLHLVVTTREDPAFPLVRLRARGQLTEIRARDLRFTGEEIQPFLNQVHHLNLPPAAIDKLLAITEGWAAGLHLTGLAFQNEEDAESFFDTFSGTHQYIIEYLVEEVLRRQPAEIRRFLACTSILDRFNAELCAELIVGSEELPASCQLSTDNCRLVLASLEHSNLFLIPLDSSREWYRYHRLFADVLRAGLDAQTEAALHLRAARWFDRQDLPVEAIPHYLAAGAFREAGRLVSKMSTGLIQNGELNMLLGWIQALPPAEVRADPVLLADQALALLLTGAVGQAAAILESAGPTANARPGSGPLLAVKAWLGLVCGGNLALQNAAQQALAALEPDQIIFRVLALLSLGTGYQVNRNLAASNEAFQEAYSLGMKVNHPFGALAGLINLIYNLYDMGQLRKARALCLDALERYAGPRGTPLPLQGMVAVPLASICLEQNDLVQARHYARLGQEVAQKLFSSGMMGGDAEVTLATVAFLEGDREQAFAIAAEMKRFAVEHSVAFLEDKMIALEAALHLRAGNIAAVRDSLDHLELHRRAVMATIPDFKHIVQAHVLAASGQVEDALDELAPVEQGLREEGRARVLIQVLAVKADLLNCLASQASLSEKARQLSEEALSALEEAVRLAAPEGYLQSLLRIGPTLADLLPRVRSAAPAFVDELLAALPPADRPLHPLQEEPQSVPPPKECPTPALVEPLSEQERKVLRLLIAGCSNQEIAERLFITPGTAKWHVHNILSKLDASSRSQAAARARELGLD